MTGLEQLRDGSKGCIVGCLRETTLRSSRPPIHLVHLQSSTMADAPVTEEKKPQVKPLDDDNDDSDEEGAPEIAAADG